MKRIGAFLMLITLLSAFLPKREVFAQEYYSFACENFEVSKITDSGTFEKVECYNDLTSSLTKMKENKDYVVRHKNSKSTTKIIAMNSGTVYSFPERINSSTIRVYQHPTNRASTWKETYVADEYEMVYEETTSYNDSGTGLVHVNLNGFDGYVDLENVDLVPTKFLTDYVSIYLGETEKSLPSYISMTQSYYIVEYDGPYRDLVLYYSYASPDVAGNAKKARIVVCPAFDWMQDTKRYYSKDGYTFYFDREYKQVAGTGVNYYQYLPLRSKSLISASTFDSVVSSKKESALKGMGETFLRVQNEYGVNALLLYSLACLESAYGTSYLALNKYNLFGWNAVDSSPISSASTFNSVEQCIEEQAAINLRGYLDINDWRFFGTHVGNKGSGLNVKYASDPYWGQKISSIAYQIDKLSQNKNGSLTDYDRYVLANVEVFDAKVLNENAGLLYTTRYGKNYQKMFTVIMLNDTGKVQTPNAVENGVIKPHEDENGILPAYKYDFEKSVGYMDVSQLSALNKINTSLNQLEGKIAIDNYEIENDQLHIAGTGIIENIIYGIPEDVKQTIILEDYNGNRKEFKADITEKTYNINDGNEYIYAGFDVRIPLDDIDTSYIVKLRSQYRNFYAESNLRSSNKKYSNSIYPYNYYYYQLFSNQLYNYRFEINKFASEQPVTINKPSARASLFSFDSITQDGANLYLAGQAMIYYLDYSEPVDYTVYLKGEDGRIIEAQTSNTYCPVDYSKILSIEENSDTICFNSAVEVPDGTYSIFVKVEKDGYSDVLELTNRSGRYLPSNDLVSIITDSIRNRILIRR